MSAKANRRKLYERLRIFSKKAANEAAEAIEALNIDQLETVLDSAGVEKKEFDQDVYDSMLTALSKQKGIMDSLVAEVDKLLTKVHSEPQPELRNALLATIMSHLAQVDDEEEEEPVDELPTEDDEEEEQALPAQFLELIHENQALHQDVKALTDLVEPFIEMTLTMKELVPLVQASGKIQDLEKRLKAAEKKIAGRPRVASKDNGNIVTDEQIEAEIKKGAEGEEVLLGIRLAK
jgi:hypothetical protein